MKFDYNFRVINFFIILSNLSNRGSMKRRKAIGRILMVGGGGVAAYSGYRWYDLKKSPDLASLEQHRNLIADLAEAIIPATDTPGAKEAGVHDFIIMMIKDCTEVKSQN